MSIIYSSSATSTKYYPSFRLLDGGHALGFQSVPSLLASTLPGFGEGSIWQAGEFQYREAPFNAVDHHVITAGGVKLYVILSPGDVLDITALGAPNDLETDIADLIDLAMRMDNDLIFPRRFAISRTIQMTGEGRQFHFPNSKVALIPGGSFNPILTYGSNADTGRKAVFSIGHATAGCVRCRVTGAVSLNSSRNTSGATGLVLWSAETLGKAYSNLFDLHSFLTASGFDYCFYGQGTTVPVAGSFTGTNISFVETSGCGAFNFQLNQDDIRIEVCRDRGLSVLATTLTIGEYFMYGATETDGIMLGAYASLKVDHHFVEGSFRYPVLLNGDNAQYIANIRVSSSFSSQAGQVITCNTDACSIYLTEEPGSLQGAHAAYVHRNPTPSDSGRFTFNLSAEPGNPDYKVPIVYTGGTSSTDVVEINDSCQSYLGRYKGSLKLRSIDATALTHLSETGAILGYFQPRGEVGVPVSNGGRYALYGRAGDLLGLESAANCQIKLYGVTSSSGPIEVTLWASGAGNVTVASDATGLISLASGGSSFVLTANRGNSLVLRWSPAANRWFEVSRTVY